MREEGCDQPSTATIPAGGPRPPTLLPRRVRLRRPAECAKLQRTGPLVGTGFQPVRVGQVANLPPRQDPPSEATECPPCTCWSPPASPSSSPAPWATSSTPCPC